MSVKERVMRQLEKLDESQLLELERQLDDLREKRIDRQLKALRAVAGTISDPEDVAPLEEATKRQPFFGSRELNLEP